jgi:hypothetical protein
MKKVYMVQNYDNDILEGLAVADPLNIKPIVFLIEGIGDLEGWMQLGVVTSPLPNNSITTNHFLMHAQSGGVGLIPKGWKCFHAKIAQ